MNSEQESLDTSNVEPFHKATNNNPSSLSYSEQQKIELASYSVGNKDKLGYNITKILCKGDEFVIYESNDLPHNENIRVAIHTQLEKDLAPIHNFQSIKPLYDEFLSIYAKLECDFSYKKRAASALSMAILGQIEESQSLFEKIMDDARKTHFEKISSRLVYQTGSILAVIIMCLISILAYLYRDSEIIKNNHIIFSIVMVLSSASIGGFLSISMKLGELNIEKNMHLACYFFLGIQRIFISMAGGIFVYALIKSKIAFGFLNTDAQDLYAIITLCILAGFSETLVPNALKNLETKASSENK
jgi:hypothetical protein